MHKAQDLLSTKDFAQSPIPDKEEGIYWNFVWKDSIGMTWYVELIINNRKYSIISPDRIGVLLFL